MKFLVLFALLIWHSHDVVNAYGNSQGNVHAQGKFQQAFSWRSLGFSGLPVSAAYNFTHPVPFGIAKHKNRIYIGMARRNSGIPVTLGYININDQSQDPLIIPYPSYQVNSLSVSVNRNEFMKNVLRWSQWEINGNMRRLSDVWLQQSAQEFVEEMWSFLNVAIFPTKFPTGINLDLSQDHFYYQARFWPSKQLHFFIRSRKTLPTRLESWVFIDREWMPATDYGKIKI